MNEDDIFNLKDLDNRRPWWHHNGTAAVAPVTVDSSWTQKVENNLGATYRVILMLGAHAPIQTILRITINPKIERFNKKYVILRNQPLPVPDLPTALWQKAENVMHATRMKILRKGLAYPIEGPFFYFEDGEPVTIDNVLGSIQICLNATEESASA